MKSSDTPKSKIAMRFKMMKRMTETSMGLWATSILIDLNTMHWMPLIVDEKEALGDNICKLEEFIKGNRLRYDERFYVLSEENKYSILDMKHRELRLVFSYHNPKRISELIDEVRILNYEHMDDKLYIREVNHYLKTHG
jgi:hypothetical protein